jgi:hypothetical protein
MTKDFIYEARVVAIMHESDMQDVVLLVEAPNRPGLNLSVDWPQTDEFPLAMPAEVIIRFEEHE